MVKLTLKDVKNRLASFADRIYPAPDDFIIKGEYLNGLPKIKNADKLIHRLIESGFVFSGFSGRLSTIKTLIITHIKNKHVIDVINRCHGLIK